MENDDRNSLEKSHESIDSLEEKHSMDWAQVPIQVVLRERPLHERQTMSLGSDDVFCDTQEGFEQRKTFRSMKAESEREISEITHDTSIDEPGGAIIYRKQNPTSLRREKFACNEHKTIENPVLVKEVTETVELKARNLRDDNDMENSVKGTDNSYDDTEVTVVKDVRAKMYDDNIGHRVDLETLYIVERANASQPTMSNDTTSKKSEESEYKKNISLQTATQGPADRLKMNNLYLMNKKILQAQSYDENSYEVHSHGGIHCVIMYVNEKQNSKPQHIEIKKNMTNERIHINVIVTADNLEYNIPHVREDSNDTGEPVSVRYVTRFETIKQERRRLGDMPLPLRTEIRRQINHSNVKLNILVVPHNERNMTKELYKSSTGKTELVSSFAQTDKDVSHQKVSHAISQTEMLTSYRLFEKYKYLLEKYSDVTHNEDVADTISIWTDDKFYVAKLSNVLLTDVSMEKKSEKDTLYQSQVYKRPGDMEKEKPLRLQINEGVQVKPKMRDEQVVTKQIEESPVSDVKNQIKHFSNNLVVQTAQSSKNRWNDSFPEIPMRVTDASQLSANGNDTLSTKTDYASDADVIDDTGPPFYKDNINTRDNSVRNHTEKSMYSYSNKTGSSDLHYEKYSLSENRTQKEKMKNIPVKVVNVQVNKTQNKGTERITKVSDNRQSFIQAARAGIKQKPLIAKNKDELIHCTLENLRKSIRQHPNDSYRVQSDYMKRSNSWSGGLNQERHVRAKLIPIWNNDKTRDFFARVDDYFNEYVAHSLKRSYSSNYLIEGPRTRVRWVRIPGETIKIEEEKTYEVRSRATAEYRELPYEMRYWNILHLLNKERVMGKQLGRNFPCPLEDWVMHDRGVIKQTAQEILSAHYPVRTPSDSVLRWFLTYDQNAALTTQKYIRALEEKGQPVNFITILPNNNNYKRVVKSIRYEKLPDRMVPVKEVYQGPAHEVIDHHKMEEQYMYQPVINQNIVQHQTEAITPRPGISSSLDRTKLGMNNFKEHAAMNKAREQQQVTDYSHMEMHSRNARMHRQFLQRRNC